MEEKGKERKNEREREWMSSRTAAAPRAQLNWPLRQDQSQEESPTLYYRTFEACAFASLHHVNALFP